MNRKIPLGSLNLDASVAVPPNAKGLVIFAHGSGSSLYSPGNRRVAQTLNRAGYATVLFDLMTATENAERVRVFDIPFLAERLKRVTRWTSEDESLKRLPIGYFGASTGAAAAMLAACELSGRARPVQAIVSRGGRPDLARTSLPNVAARTLLLVGDRDDVILELNRSILSLLPRGELKIVSGASHLFEEPGTLEIMVDSAVRWFDKHLAYSKGAPIIRNVA